MKRKEARHITWKGVSFNEHLDLGSHWELQGIVNGKRRFLLMCEKLNDKTVLLDVHNNVKHDVPLHAQQRGKNLAEKILDDEQNGTKI